MSRVQTRHRRHVHSAASQHYDNSGSSEQRVGSQPVECHLPTTATTYNGEPSIPSYACAPVSSECTFLSLFLAWGDLFAFPCGDVHPLIMSGG
jgi:hypothetical protein